MTEGFEILLIYPYGELVFFLRGDFVKSKSIRLVTTLILLVRLCKLRRGTTQCLPLPRSSGTALRRISLTLKAT
jgi:hypothetical protein